MADDIGDAVLNGFTNLFRGAGKFILYFVKADRNIKIYFIKLIAAVIFGIVMLTVIIATYLLLGLYPFLIVLLLSILVTLLVFLAIILEAKKEDAV